MATLQPELKTERLLLRPFRLSDADRVLELVGDESVATTTLNIPHPYEEGTAESWIATHATQFYSGTGVVYAVTLMDGPDEVIGAIGLRINAGHRRAELGYWVGVPYWGNGYCTEAARELIRYGFEQLGLHKIFARHMKRNPASGRVMAKAGMVLEGELKGEALKDGVFHDLFRYAILNHDGRGNGNRSNPVKLKHRASGSGN